MKKGRESKPPTRPKPPKAAANRSHARKRGESLPAGAFEDRESENASGPRVPKRLDAGGPRGSR